MTNLRRYAIWLILPLLVAVVAFASQKQATPDVRRWDTAVTAVGVAVVTWLLTRGKQRAETAQASAMAVKADAEAELADATARQKTTETIASLSALVRTFEADAAQAMTRARAAEARAQAAEDAVAQQATLIEALRAELAELRAEMSKLTGSRADPEAPVIVPAASKLPIRGEKVTNEHHRLDQP